MTDERRPHDPFPLIKDHVLLRWASQLDAVDEPLAALLTPAVVRTIVGWIPASWLAADDGGPDVDAVREAYVRHLLARLEPPRRFAQEAIGAR